jgi:hypothetical protein
VLWVTSLWEHSLTKHAYLNANVQISFVSAENFFYLFIFLIRFNVYLFGYCRSTYFTLCLLHIVLAFQELDKQTIISSVGCSKGSRLKYVWSNYLPPFTKGVLNESPLSVIWRTAKTRDVCTALSRYSNINGWLRTAHNWGQSVVFWSHNVPQMFGCSEI